MFPRHLYGSRHNPPQPIAPWQYPYHPPGGSTTQGRLFNGFSYPGHLNHLTSASEESAPQGALISPPPHSTPAVSHAAHRFFDISGGVQFPDDVVAPPPQYCPTKPIDTFQSMGHLAPSRAPPFAQPFLWPGGMPIVSLWQKILIQ